MHPNCKNCDVHSPCALHNTDKESRYSRVICRCGTEIQCMIHNPPFGFLEKDIYGCIYGCTKGKPCNECGGTEYPHNHSQTPDEIKEPWEDRFDHIFTKDGGQRVYGSASAVKMFIGTGLNLSNFALLEKVEEEVEKLKIPQYERYDGSLMSVKRREKGFNSALSQVIDILKELKKLQ